MTTTSSTLEDVLGELEAVEQTGPDEWKARCPAHDDNNPSLSVTVGEDYPVLLHCHAGCEFEEVAEELDSLSTHWKPWEGTEIDRYTYRDAGGEPLFDVVRYEMRDEEHPACGEKQFVQQAYLPGHEEAGERGCPDGYVWGRKKHDVGVVLYRLPEVVEAVENGRRVFVVEGEKDVHTFEDMGFVATTNPQGAGKWHRRFTSALEGARVEILPDNDGEGHKHARRVAQEILPVVESVRIVELPDLPEKGDVTDWAEAGGTAEELRRIMHETPQFEPTSNGKAESPDADFGDRYEADSGRIMHVSSGDESGKIVADFEAGITREVTDEDESRTYRIEGRTRQGRPFEFNIPASDFERDRKLKSAIGAAAGAEAPVRAGMTRHISPALKMLSGNVQKIRRYRRTGWSDDGFILPGCTPEDVEVELPESLPYQASSGGSVEEGQVALDNLIRSLGPEKTSPLVAFAVTGQLGRHIDLLKRHAFFIKGRTGSLKTSWAQVLMCLFGPGFLRDENLLKMGEGMTRNAAMALAGSAHDLPILFDNYKPTTGQGDRGFINLIHNVIEGGEKARLNRNSELKDRKDIRAWPVVTGEDLPDTDSASLARLLTVEFSWTDGEDNPELTAAQRRPEDLSRLGAAWIEWLQSEEGREAMSELEETFPERRKKWARYLRENRPDMVNILRVASNLATNTLAFNAAAHCPMLREVLESHREAYQDGMLQIAYDMGDYTCESLEARRFIEGLKSLKAAGRARFAQRLSDDYTIDDQVGYKDAEGYYLILDLAKEKVEELYKSSGGLGGVTNQTLCSQLSDIDLVARTGRSRTTRNVRTATGQQRVLHLKKEALEEPKQDDE